MTTTITTALAGKRTVLYGRLSSERQAQDSKSVDDQLSALRSWAGREGVKVVAEHRDDGVSASRYAKGTKVREDWIKVMGLITSGLVEILAVWSIARATRDRAVWAALIAACQDHGVLLAVDGKIQDPSDPDDSFMLDIQAALAFNGSARISKDARRAVDSRASRGAPHGRVLDGYRIETDRAGKPVRRVIDPVRGPIIREIVTRLLAGQTAYRIAQDFNDRGLTTITGRPWDSRNIVKRIQSPSLAGLRVHHGEVLEGVTAEWPALISMEEFHRLQALLSDPKRKSNHEGRTVKHLGTGIYECGNCHSPVRMISGLRKDGSRRIRYACPNFCVQRGTEPIDLMVETAIVEFLSRPDIFLELAEEGGDADVALASEEAAKIRAELAEAVALFESGELSVAFLARAEKSLTFRLEDAERRARPKHIPTPVYDVAGPQAAERWEATDILAKRVIVKALLRVEIHPQGGRGSKFDPTAIRISRRS